MANSISELNGILEDFNKKAKEFNLPEVVIVDPVDCIGQDKNARYFVPEVFQQLVDNIKKDNRLESTPLLYRDPEKEGKFRIISGHHRIEAAKQAGVKQILAFVIEPSSRDEIVSKQLSHNSLVGIDDKFILAELFNEIRNIQQKIASGLKSEIEKVEYISLNFRLGSYKEIILLFIPGDSEKIDQVFREMEEILSVKEDSEIRIAPLEVYDKFADQLRKIKKVKNIKNNAVAFKLMVSVCEEEVHKMLTANVKEEKKNATGKAKRKSV